MHDGCGGSLRNRGLGNGEKGCLVKGCYFRQKSLKSSGYKAGNTETSGSPSYSK